MTGTDRLREYTLQLSPADRDYLIRSLQKIPKALEKETVTLPSYSEAAAFRELSERFLEGEGHVQLQWARAVCLGFYFAENHCHASGERLLDAIAGHKRIFLQAYTDCRDE